MPKVAARVYRAPRWLPGGHAQTIWTALRARPPAAWQRERWNTPDGDFIDVDFAGNRAAARTVVLFHGLEGNSASHYARRLAAACLDRTLAVPHFRGCSGEPNRLQRAYHSGDSAEIDWILRRLRARSAGVTAIGFSLGANVLLKWLGEQRESAVGVIDAASAVSTPFDLRAAANTIDTGIGRLLYARHFLATLRAKALAKLERFPGLYSGKAVRRARTLRQFDDLVTAPLHGFLDAEDYWARASSLPWLGGVRVPTLLVSARNDPFLPATVLDRVADATRRDASAREHLLLEFFDDGGHAAFPDATLNPAADWLPMRLLAFLADPRSRNPVERAKEERAEEK